MAEGYTGLAEKARKACRTPDILSIDREIISDRYETLSLRWRRRA